MLGPGSPHLLSLLNADKFGAGIVVFRLALLSLLRPVGFSFVSKDQIEQRPQLIVFVLKLEELVLGWLAEIF